MYQCLVQMYFIMEWDVSYGELILSIIVVLSERLFRIKYIFCCEAMSPKMWRLQEC